VLRLGVRPVACQLQVGHRTIAHCVDVLMMEIRHSADCVVIEWIPAAASVDGTSACYWWLSPARTWSDGLFSLPWPHLHAWCKSVFSERELTFTFAICYRPSVCRLSVICNVRAPYSGGSNFRQYFYGVRYLGHPLTSNENFTEIVPREPLRRGS